MGSYHFCPSRCRVCARSHTPSQMVSPSFAPRSRLPPATKNLRQISSNLAHYKEPPRTACSKKKDTTIAHKKGHSSFGLFWTVCAITAAWQFKKPFAVAQLVASGCPMGCGYSLYAVWHVVIQSADERKESITAGSLHGKEWIL